MTEKTYSHDPHSWPIFSMNNDGSVSQLPAGSPGRVLTDDDIKALVVLAELAIQRLKRLEVTAPPKPKPEPEGDDDIPDVA
jgi:hypothetical protein